jgi:hypothetical protein
VPGRGDHVDGEAAGQEALAVGEQAVELAAVRRELVAEVEHRLEHALDLADALADGDDGAGEAGAQHLRARHVIGVRVRLEHGAQQEPLAAQEVADAVDGLGEDQRGERVVVEDRIDHQRVPGVRVVHDVRGSA